MENERFSYPEGKTNYQIIDEHNEKTSITLEKWVVDILQIELPDVHKSIQNAYDKFLLKKPELTRRERGNYIRELSVNSANQFQDTKKKIIGWNNQDFLDSFE